VAKEFFDISVFTDPKTALGLLGNAVRKGIDYNSLAPDRTFQAVVLTYPYDITSAEALGITRSSGKTQPQGEDFKKFVFKGRILGNNSPHAFLPDPCTLDETEDPKCAIQILQMHTTFISSDDLRDPSNPRPNIGDIVNVKLQQNIFSYDLQYGEYISLSQKNAQDVKIPSNACEAIAAIFDNMEEFATGASGPEAADPNALTLQGAYQEVEATTTSTKIGFSDLYEKLLAELGDKNLVLGLVANAYAESGLVSQIVSGAPGESSLGLWQMNVGRPGWWGLPNSTMGAQFDSQGLPYTIKLGVTTSVPYFAGALLAKENGVNIMTAEEYVEQFRNDPAGTHERIREIYEITTNADNQIKFVVSTIKKMISNLNYDKETITPENWTQWVQIYFEQPAQIHDRTPHVKAAQQAIT